MDSPFLPTALYLNKHAGGSEGLIGPSLGERRRREGASEALEGGVKVREAQGSSLYSDRGDINLHTHLQTFFNAHTETYYSPCVTYAALKPH